MRLALSKAKRLIAAVMGLSMLISTAPTGIIAAETTAEPAETAARYAGITPHVTRIADPITMNDFKTKLLNDESGSRFAGRV